MAEADGAPDGLLEVGRVGRAHGVKGAVMVTLSTDRTERLDPGSRLWCRGSWRTVRSAVAHSGRWLVTFDDVDGRSAAERLTSAALHAEPVDDPDVMWVHELIGADVVEIDGTARGTCVSVVQNPAADLLELDGGALVPVTFVESVSDGTITIDVPDGLFDLYDAGPPSGAREA